jgi:hypothetical protein
MKLKLHFLLIGFLSFTGGNLFSQTTLTEGDIAFTRINMDDESFSFVFLVPIANTTQFIITDESWNSSNVQGNSESKIRFTATSSFLAGEEISISATALSFASTGSGTATLTSIGTYDPSIGNMLGSAGDNLFIYQPEGTPGVNDFVAGINANSGASGTPGNAWQIVSTSSTSSSGLPSGLTNGTNALGIYPFGGAQSEVDNARYKSTALRSGDKATVLAAIMNLSNWEYHNSTVQPPVGTSFTISGTLSTGDINVYQKKVKIYPNPSIDFLKIEGLKKIEKYEIYNSTGSKIMTGEVSNSEKINIQSLSIGTYFLKFENKNILKFIKK